MKDVFNMAGYYVSHSIVNISSGETLKPLLGYSKNDGSHTVETIEASTPVEAISIGGNKIRNLSDEIQGAVLINDGLVTLDTGKTDTLVIDIRFNEELSKKVKYILPYRNAKHEDGFAVHKLKIIELDGISLEETMELSKSFFDGVQENSEGWALWTEHHEEKPGEGMVAYDQGDKNLSYEEFKKLKQAPFLIYFLVASADGEIDKKEMLQFMEVLSNPESHTNPIFSKIINIVTNDIDAIVTEMKQQPINYIEELSHLKDIVNNNLPEHDANNFKLTLLLLGKKIAEASGGFLGFGDKISREELAALQTIAACLEIKDP